MFVRNGWFHVQGWTASQPSRPQPEQSLPWKPEILISCSRWGSQCRLASWLLSTVGRVSLKRKVDFDRWHNVCKLQLRKFMTPTVGKIISTDSHLPVRCLHLYRQTSICLLFSFVLTDVYWSVVFICTDRHLQVRCLHLYWQTSTGTISSFVLTDIYRSAVFICTDRHLRVQCLHLYWQTSTGPLSSFVLTDIYRSAVFICTDRHLPIRCLHLYWQTSTDPLSSFVLTDIYRSAVFIFPLSCFKQNNERNSVILYLLLLYFPANIRTGYPVKRVRGLAMTWKLLRRALCDERQWSMR